MGSTLVRYGFGKFLKNSFKVGKVQSSKCKKKGFFHNVIKFQRFPQSNKIYNSGNRSKFISTLKSLDLC